MPTGIFNIVAIDLQLEFVEVKIPDMVISENFIAFRMILSATPWSPNARKHCLEQCKRVIMF